MNFKTPFKVLTTAALIGTLSLSAVAPGAASAAEKTVTAQAETPANFAIEKVILVKGDSKISVSFDTYIDALGNEKALNGYELAYVVAANGEVFALETYVDFYEEGNTEKEVVEKLSKAGKTSEVTEVKDGAFNDGKLEPVEDTAATAKVESVKAINAKTLEVTFNTTADVKAEDFSVTKGSVKNNIASVVLAEDGKSATVELSSKLTKGEYTVTVAQKDADALVGKAQVEDEKVAELKISSNVAVFTSAARTSAKVTAQVLNQYGEDITKLHYADVTATPAGAASTVTQQLNNKGEIVFNVASGSKEGDKAILTLVHAKSGVSTNKTIELSGVAAASEIEVGDVYNKDGKTLNQDTDFTKDKFYLPVTVKDQYGNVIDDATKVNTEVVFTNSNPAVATISSSVSAVTINGKEVLALEVTDVNLAGTANLVAVSKTTGSSVTKTVTVEAGVNFNTVSVGSPIEVLSAKKDAHFPLTVIDSTGKEIKTLKDLALVKQDELTESSGYDIVELDDKEGLYVKVPFESVEEDKAVTVVVTSKSGKVATQTVVARAEAVPTVITGISSKVSKALRANQTPLTINNTDLVVEDQYGQVITDKTKLAAINFNAEVEAGSASDRAVTVGTSNSTSVTIAPKANTSESSARVTFKLELGSTDAQTAKEEASALTTTFSIVKDSQFDSYVIKDVPTIYAKKAQASDKEGTIVAAYDQDLEIIAKTADGKEIELTEDVDYTVTGQPTTTVDFKDDKATTVTVPVTVTINATGEEFTKELTYSNVAPKVAKVQLVKDGTVVDNTGDSTLTATTKIEEAQTVEFTSGTAFKIDSLVDLVDIVVTDTYGQKVAAVETTGAFVVTLADTTTKVATQTLTLSKVTDNTTFVSNGTVNAKVTEYVVGSEFNSLLKLDGVSGNSVKVIAKTDGYSASGEANQSAVDTEANKYETTATVAKTVAVNEDITATVAKLKNLETADSTITVSYSVAQDAKYLKVVNGKVLLKAQPANGASDNVENVTITFSKGGKTKTATVAVTVTP